MLMPATVCPDRTAVSHRCRRDSSHTRVRRSPSASTSLVKNEQIEADVEQLMDLMKTRKQQLESLLNEKMKDFGLICVLENVR